jgi:hypothetical protein
MRERVERLERSLADKQLLLGKGGSRRGSSSIDAIVDTISINYLSLNARTVEIVAIVSFFFIGVVIGASLLDRLWLLGGVGFAYWASGAVHRESMGGLIARRVGVQVTQFIRDVQEKYMQMMLFYRTGQMAYVSQVEWQKYDQRFRLSQRSGRALSLLAGYVQRLSKTATEAERRLGVLQRVGATSRAAASVLGKAARNVAVASGPILSPLGLGGLSSSFSSPSSPSTSQGAGGDAPLKGLIKAGGEALNRAWAATKGGAQRLIGTLPALQVQVEWEQWEPLKAWSAGKPPLSSPLFSSLLLLSCLLAHLLTSPPSSLPSFDHSFIFSSVAHAWPRADKLQAAKRLLGMSPRPRPSVNPWGAPFKAYKRQELQRGAVLSSSLLSISEGGGGGGIADWWGPSAKQQKTKKRWTVSVLGLSVTVGRGAGTGAGSRAWARGKGRDKKAWSVR